MNRSLAVAVCAGAALCLPARADCLNVTGDVKTMVTITVPPTAVVVATSARSVAVTVASATAWEFYPCCIENCFESETQADVSAEVSLVDGRTLAIAHSHANARGPDTGLHVSTDSHAQTSMVSAVPPQIYHHVEGSAGVYRCNSGCAPAPYWYGHMSVMAASQYTVELQSGTGSFFYTYNPRVGGSGIFAGPDGLVRVGGFFRPRAGVLPIVSAVMGSQGVAAPHGMTYDSGAQEWYANPTVQGQSGDTLLTGSFRFSDQSIDVNSDGRFNSADVDTLTTKISSTLEADMKWDFNANEEIDATDVEIMESLILGGLGSGLLGDVDQDGVQECEDIAAISLMGDSTFGDVDYLVELDANLDGLIDATDRLAACRAVQPADRNCDGVVDFVDYLDYQNEYGSLEPSADMNGDEIVDFSDWLEFLNWYGIGCL